MLRIFHNCFFFLQQDQCDAKISINTELISANQDQISINTLKSSVWFDASRYISKSRFLTCSSHAFTNSESMKPRFFHEISLVFF